MHRSVGILRGYHGVDGAIGFGVGAVRGRGVVEGQDTRAVEGVPAFAHNLSHRDW